MGWYTELRIKSYHWSWRKSLPIEVPLLFYGKYKTIGQDINNLNLISNKFIGFEATVKQVISNLDKLGLTLDFFISTYATYRNTLIKWDLGILHGQLEAIKHFKNDKADAMIEQTKSKIRRIEQSSPSKDIHSAIQILKEKIDIKSMLLDDESIIPSMNHASLETEFDDPFIIEALSFGTFLTYISENLPEIAWLYEIRLILATMDSRTKVKLDMSEWVAEGLDMNIINESIEWLGLKAKTYAKTFDAILGGQETYNIEYERARLIEGWRKLNSLKGTDITKGVQLEDFISILFHKKFGFSVVSKRLVADTQELDIILKNSSKNDFIRNFSSPFILIECKNWSSPVGVEEARVFESKCREAGKKINLGIFVALNGVTKPFKTHLNNISRDGLSIIIIDNKNIEEFLYSVDLNIENWLEMLIAQQFILK